MDIKYSLEDLTFMSEKALSLKGKNVIITKYNDKVVKGKITNITTSPIMIDGCIKPSSLPVNFIIDEDTVIPLTSIQTMEVCDGE